MPEQGILKGLELGKDFMDKKRIEVPSKLGLPPKWISCSSRASLACVGPFSKALLCFWREGGICFFSLLHLITSATKMLHINARTKEDMIRRSATQDGVFSLAGFFWEGTKMWLNIMRKMRNRIEEIPAMAAIQSEFSSPLIEKFKNFVPKFTVCT